MRVEPYIVGSYLHVIKRGARGLPIVRDNDDKWRFLKALYLLNDSFFDSNWIVSTEGKDMFHRRDTWPEREPLVDIVAYTLLPNHFHLIVRETQEGGMSHFMKKLGQSMTNHSNGKYDEQGSLFQGAFKSKTCTDDTYMRYLFAYVMVKNTFELYPEGGLAGAQNNFEDAWQWSITYPFSSLSEYAEKRKTAIVTKQTFQETFPNNSFKSFAKDVVLSGKWLEPKLH